METRDSSPATPSLEPPPRANPWTLPLVLCAVAALAATWLLLHEAATKQPAPGAAHATWTPAPRPEGDTASLVIDFGNGALRQFQALPCPAGQTLGGLMQQARRFQPGLRYTQQGEGDMAFLTSLEGVANEGGRGRYWFYEVDGRRGDSSFQVQPLTPGAKVLWVYKKPE
jgi:hypothetical protein